MSRLVSLCGVSTIARVIGYAMGQFETQGLPAQGEGYVTGVWVEKIVGYERDQTPYFHFQGKS